MNELMSLSKYSELYGCAVSLKFDIDGAVHVFVERGLQQKTKADIIHYVIPPESAENYTVEKLNKTVQECVNKLYNL